MLKMFIKLYRKIFPNKFFRNILLKEGTPILSLKLFFTFFSFISSIIFVRFMGSENYGVYSHVTAIIEVLRMPVQFGLPLLVIRETAKYVAHENWGLVKGIWKWSSLFIITTSTLIISLSLLTLYLLKDKVNPEYSLTFLWGVSLIPFLSYNSLRGGQLRGLNKVVISQIPEQVFVPITQIVFLITFGFLIASDVKSSTAMMFYLIAALVAFFVGIRILNRNTPSEVKIAEPIIQGKSWFSSTLIIAGISGFGLINRQISIIIVGLLVENASEVSYYKAAINFSFLAAFGLQVFYTIVGPRFAAFFAKNENESLQQLATLSSRVILLINLAITTVLVLFGKPVLRAAYGPEFLVSYIPMLVLLFGQFINSATGAVSSLLMMAGKEVLIIKIVALSMIINLTLNLTLTPNLGIMGGAIGTSASLIIENILSWIAVRREMGINCFAFDFRKKNT